MVVMKASHMEQLCLDHLSDTTTYVKLARDPTNSLRIKVNKTLKNILTARGFPSTFINNLQTPTTARTQRFYALPKTHKEVLKIRPIVSACGGIFDRLGWFLQQLLKPLLNHVKAHLNNTSDLIARFDSMESSELEGMIPVSFDVISLYTNIDMTEAIETSLEYARRHRLCLYGLKMEDLWELLHLILENNVFRYQVTYFKQIRGLAMGNRLSGTLAIICMDKFEHNYIYNELEPKIYVRYVDDIGTTVKTPSQAYNLLQYMNSKHKTIKFEIELPDSDGFLPILDTRLKIKQDGTIERKLFTKSANKGITLNFDSHHSSATKSAVVHNELRRANICSTTEHRQLAIETTRNKLIRNGYPRSVLNANQKRKVNRETGMASTPMFTLKIPFISDKLNHQIRRTLAKHDIPARLVNPRGKTIRDLTRHPDAAPDKICHSKCCPAPGICQRSNVVYEATCMLCEEFYVGMTTRKLHDRAREHVHSASQRNNNTALGDHYRERHGEKEQEDGTIRGSSKVKYKESPKIRFKIIQHHPDLLRLHIEEAIAIKRLAPTLNRRQETLGTGFLP